MDGPVYTRRSACKCQKMSEEAVQFATSIKVEALAQLGRMLKETPKAKGRDYGGRTKIDGTRALPSIDALLHLNGVVCRLWRVGCVVCQCGSALVCLLVGCRVVCWLVGWFVRWLVR